MARAHVPHDAMLEPMQGWHVGAAGIRGEATQWHAHRTTNPSTFKPGDRATVTPSGRDIHPTSPHHMTLARLIAAPIIRSPGPPADIITVIARARSTRAMWQAPARGPRQVPSGFLPHVSQQAGGRRALLCLLWLWLGEV